MPEMLPEGESIPADAHRLIIGPATHWVVLKDGGIIFQRGDEIVHADGEETTNLQPRNSLTPCKFRTPIGTHHRWFVRHRELAGIIAHR